MRRVFHLKDWPFLSRWVEDLKKLGVECVFYGAGNRNWPLIQAFKQAGLILYDHVDERSASFASLGFNRYRGGLKSLVLVTSGTAVGECLPAVMESYHQRVPLLVVSADRVRNAVNQAMAQTTYQTEPFKPWAPTLSLDLSDEHLWNVFYGRLASEKGPFHVNWFLDDWRWFMKKPPDYPKLWVHAKTGVLPGPEGDLGNLKHPLWVFTPLTGMSTPPLWQGSPPSWVVVEPLAWNWVQPLGITASLPFVDDWIEDLFQKGVCDGLIVVGDLAPVWDFWRRWDECERAPIPVFVISRGAQTFRRQKTFCLSYQEIHPKPTRQPQFIQAWKNKFHELCQAYPRSYWGLMYRLWEESKVQRLFVGNSLVYRNLARILWHPVERIWGLRGLSGIDGNLSAFLGWAMADSTLPAVAWVGDLTTLADLNSLWFQRRGLKNIIIVVWNDQGGGIFRPWADDDLVLAHDWDLSAWARIFQVEYVQWPATPWQNIERMAQNRVIVVEVKPELPQQESLELAWKEWISRWAKEF